jgi:chromosome segregation ATPase
MAKTVDQRVKELNDGVTWVIANNWDNAIAKFQKELNAPNFKSLGSMAGLAANFDKAQSTFEQNVKKKDDAKKLFESAAAPLAKMHTQTDGFKKDLDDIVKDAAAARKQIADADNVDDMLKNAEETLKAQEDVNKERKSIFDNWMKVDVNHAKVIADTIAKVKKEVAAAQAALNSSNTQLNSLETQIRALVVKYENTARSMDREDIAAAVRGFLHVFGK